MTAHDAGERRARGLPGPPDEWVCSHYQRSPQEQRCVVTVDRIEKVGPMVAFLFLLRSSTGYGWEIKVETW